MKLTATFFILILAVCMLLSPAMVSSAYIPTQQPEIRDLKLSHPFEIRKVQAKNEERGCLGGPWCW
ncbi:uncharacterized protein FA14DRAFT_182670 [Meira miltonrushii]|uniref:Uncharacterized protein n=1 Tax=Meira miltonrushii TaxID=1280837 RepID=A0A316V1M3_9BASI|nr:uncharacterized protein FA14DRAFT_182670 [Meira miltonrushii]PWN31450.1 hypothetical protein FA14DRAFT_182670 [Meira miltonrushii]